MYNCIAGKIYIHKCKLEKLWKKCVGSRACRTNSLPAEITIKLEFSTGLLLKTVFWLTNRADDCKQPSQANSELSIVEISVSINRVKIMTGERVEYASWRVDDRVHEYVSTTTE